MLGKLFNLTSSASVAAAATPTTAPGQSTKPISSLESVQEDIHTRNLLFPDAQALFQHRNDQVFPLSTASTHPAASTADAFDYEGDVELDTRDVRVLIMQDALSSMPATLLYDSQQPPSVPTSPVPERASTTGMAHVNLPDARRVPTSPRKPSMGHSARPVIIQPGSPQSRHGPFDRRPSIQSRAQPRVESESQRAYREYNEELAGFSSCIFGNSELLAYKGTSTKVHLVPSDHRSDYANPVAGDGRGSFGRASMRSSKLSQSFSSEAVAPFPNSGSPFTTARAADRKKVLITRLFPVSLPSDDDDPATPFSRVSEDSSGYPFPPYGEDHKGKKKKPQPKQKRTPMYAVALIVNLPQGCSQPNSAAPAKPSFRGQGSYTEQDSFPSSYGSARRSGWTMVGLDSLDTSYTSDIEDRIDPITQHWDIIMRTLSHMQSAVAAVLYSMLKHADIASPDPFPASISSHMSRTPSLTRRRSEDGGASKPPKTNAKLVSLFPNCLLENTQIKTEVEVARARIVNGLRASRVITGQNRWSIWREEARWVARWAAEKEQAPFFYNLLTSFLATHTDWLQALSPAWYRRRHMQQQRARGDEVTSLPARTIIVSQDKMAARRLIFLLSSFLPANQQLPTMRMHRPSTSTSWGAGFSQSPPSFVVPILKEESLRRKINRRSGLRRASHSRSASMQGPNPRSSGVPVHLAHLATDRSHERRASDASSIRTTNLPITGGDYTSRKSSTATAATIAPEPTMAHFATLQRAETTGSHGRPGTASSMAADDLKRTLRRGDSIGNASLASTDSRNSSRWGSVISGLWNGRRRLSTDFGAQTRDSLDSGGSITSSPNKAHRKRISLSQMVKEAQILESPDKTQSAGPSHHASREALRTAGLGSGTPDLRQSQTSGQFQRTPDPAGAFESPVKTSINAEDGVIDVDVPFPEYITSFETAVSSPSSSGYLSTPGLGNGLDAFEQSCRVAVDGDLPLNVAGWLQSYHPDFVLQAIPPVEGDLLGHVRDSLRAEASPPPSSYSMSMENQHERWVDISNVVVADTTNFTITRIRYRRLIKLAAPNDKNTPSLPGSFNRYGSLQATPLFPPQEVQLEEEFIEEPVASLDDVLIEAVEKVIAHGSDMSKVSSTCSSRSASIRRDRSNSTSTGSDEPGTVGQLRQLAVTSAPHEVPRAECKAVVLSALEDIVKEVIDKREKESRSGEELERAREQESSLKRAVRTWMENVEMGE